MANRELARNCEDVDETVLNFAEIKAIASGNPLIMEKMKVDNEVTRLRVLKAAYDGKRYILQDAFTFQYPQRIQKLTEELEKLENDIKTRNQSQEENPEFEIILKGIKYEERKEAGEILREIMVNTDIFELTDIGSFKGFQLKIREIFMGVELMIMGEKSYKVELSNSDIGNMVRLENTLNGLEKEAEKTRHKILEIKVDMENAKMDYDKDFQYEDLLKEMLQRQTEINTQLEIKEEPEVICGELEETTVPKQAVSAR